MAVRELTPFAGVPARDALPWATLAGRLGLGRLPGRDLDVAELQEVAATVAADPSLWRHHVGFDDDHRVYASLHRDAHVDVWLLCWTPVNDTGWHDHDVSSGAVAVVSGQLVEHNLSLQAPPVATPVPSGHVFGFGPEHIHRLTGAVPGSVSVHAYSPPLQRMGQYTVDESGVLRRTSVSYVEELRPLR